MYGLGLKTAINMHNTLYNNQLAGQIVCGSPTAGGLDRTSQSVECSGPYVPGGYSDSCFVDIYFKNQGQYASGTTPTWQFQAALTGPPERGSRPVDIPGAR